MSRVVARGAVIAALAGVVACASLLPRAPAREDGAALAADRGCTGCHAQAAAPLGRAPIPVAPAWQEIATRYRGQPGAHAELVAVLIGGTEERHWKGEPFVSMLPHEKWVTAQDANTLVAWILAR